jgi:hypothetical protein
VTDHVTKRDRDHVTSSVASTSKVQADDGSWIPSTYRDFLDIFSKKKAETLPPHRPTDHAIDLEPGTKLPYGRIYSLSEVELKALKSLHRDKPSKRFHLEVLITSGVADPIR